MRGPSKHTSRPDPEGTREEFPDGSALIAYPDGRVLILETALSKQAVLRESRPVNYNDPPLPPIAES